MLSLTSKARGSFEICIGIVAVTSFSSYTSEARGLKIGMQIPHMKGSEVTGQIFDILSRS